MNGMIKTINDISVHEYLDFTCNITVDRLVDVCRR